MVSSDSGSCYGCNDTALGGESSRYKGRLICAGGLDEMPLPRPDKKNLQRLSSLYNARNGKPGALDKISDSSSRTEGNPNQL